VNLAAAQTPAFLGGGGHATTSDAQWLPFFEGVAAGDGCGLS
jgi:hypothetical protein